MCALLVRQETQVGHQEQEKEQDTKNKNIKCRICNSRDLYIFILGRSGQKDWLQLGKG